MVHCRGTDRFGVPKMRLRTKGPKLGGNIVDSAQNVQGEHCCDVRGDTKHIIFDMLIDVTRSTVRVGELRSRV